MAAKQKELPFRIEKQKEFMWCWSAVGTSCAVYYKVPGQWTQCKMASLAIVPSPGDCCSVPESKACAITWYLVNPEQTEGSLVTAGIADGFVEGAIPYTKLKALLDEGTVVAYRLSMELDKQKFFHFIVVSGYEEYSGHRMVTVNDPFFGESMIPYGEFIDHYKTNGKVTHTYFTKKTSLHDHGIKKGHRPH